MMQSYYKTTPTKWRKIGDALLGASTSITTFAIFNEQKWIALTALIIGASGKFLTNLFTEDKPVT
jgi:hypothetical protein